MYVSTPEGLAQLIEQMSGSPVLAVDTEFQREHTYYAKLCLIQLATDDVEAIVDPLAIRDITPLAQLFSDPAMVKVFHCGIQDVEIIYRACGVIPKPLFDTQAAAAILGQQRQVGYAALVNEYCNVRLPKADSLTDWTRRPLSRTQVKYALDDVHYLPGIYRKLVSQLEELGRSSWMQPEIDRLTNPATYENDPDEAWRRVKRTSSLRGPQLAALQVIAAWRERTAQRRDLPRRFVLSDEVVAEMARRIPEKVEDVFTLRGTQDHMSTAECRRIIADVQKAVKRPPSEWPQLKRRGSTPPDVEAEAALLSALAHMRAKEHNVNMSILAPHDEMVKLAQGETEGVSLAQGWRREVVGEDMLALLDGKIALSIENHHLKVTDLRREGGEAAN